MPENNTSSSSTHNPAQNELDLGFTQVEPITPKKPVIPEPSMFERAKSMFGRKETPETASFSVRKEPTFGSQDLSQQVKEMVSNTINEAERKLYNQTRATMAATEPLVNEAVSNAASEENIVREPEQPNANEDDLIREFESLKAKSNIPAAEKNMKNLENLAIMQKLPPRHRRLIIALAAVLILLSVFFWLKPDSHTVEDFQAQNSGVQPIEFQPLDQTKIAQEAVANANDVANMLDNATQPGVNNPGNAPVPAQDPNNTQSPAQTQTVTTPADQTVTAVPPTPEAGKPAEKAQEQAVTRSKPQQVVPEQKQQPKQPNKKSNVTTTENKVELPSAVGTKTLTIKQGVSLMQVFRDNNLSVADVNAMTKVKGAESVLSNFKSGDKVQVFLNRQGRVSTLRLSDGGTFTRQPDGSYKYTK